MQIEKQKHDGVQTTDTNKKSSIIIPPIITNLVVGIKSKTRRRISAYNRLVLQLKSNRRPQKMAAGIFGSGPSTVFIDLTDKDKDRILKELETLKSRI